MKKRSFAKNRKRSLLLQGSCTKNGVLSYKITRRTPIRKPTSAWQDRVSSNYSYPVGSRTELPGPFDVVFTIKTYTINETTSATLFFLSTSLYEKSGGAKDMASIVDQVVAAYLENPEIRARILPYLNDMDKAPATKRHFCEFLGMGCGGPETYSGRDMLSVHHA